MTFDQVNHISDSALLQTELLLVETTVLDAAAEIVQSLSFDYVRKHQLLRLVSLTSRNPEEVADVELSHFVLHVTFCQFL